MDKQETLEIRKLLTKNNCRIDRIAGCFVDENGQVITDLKDTWRAMPEEEVEKYCELFRKTLTGKQGKNLFHLEFPLREEEEGGRQNLMYRVLQDNFHDPALVQGFCRQIIQNLSLMGRYLILLGHGAYDIPAKSSDGTQMDDASEYVYLFLVCCICPVTEIKEGLCFDEESLTFINKRSDLGVQAPEVGFLFPEFNDRAPDIHAVQWYAKKEEERHPELIDGLVGGDMPVTVSAQKEQFKDIVEQTLGRDCDFENVKSLTEAVDEMLKEQKDNPEPVELGKTEVRRLLHESGAAPDSLGQTFEESFDEMVGEGGTINAESIGGRSVMEIRSPSVKISVKSDMTQMITTRIIDGREYLLIPVQDNIELNGIRILNSRRLQEDQPEERD